MGTLKYSRKLEIMYNSLKQHQNEDKRNMVVLNGIVISHHTVTVTVFKVYV